MLSFGIFVPIGRPVNFLWNMNFEYYVYLHQIGGNACEHWFIAIMFMFRCSRSFCQNYEWFGFHNIRHIYIMTSPGNIRFPWSESVIFFLEKQTHLFYGRRSYWWNRKDLKKKWIPPNRKSGTVFSYYFGETQFVWNGLLYNLSEVVSARNNA